jgi:hypothetical protein
MLEVLLLRPDILGPVTIHKILIVGTVVVAIAVVFRRFGLATLTTVPLVALACASAVAGLRWGTARHASRPPVAGNSGNAQHAITEWFVAGIALVAAFLVVALLVTSVTIYRARSANAAFCYPDEADEGTATQVGDAGGAGFGWSRRDGDAASPAPPRRASRPPECLRRLTLLTREFLLCVHEGWPVRISLRAEETRWFLDALLHATHLVADGRGGLSAAVTEAERRWSVVCGSTPGDEKDGRNIPDPDSS